MENEVVYCPFNNGLQPPPNSNDCIEIIQYWYIEWCIEYEPFDLKRLAVVPKVVSPLQWALLNDLPTKVHSYIDWLTPKPSNICILSENPSTVLGKHGTLIFGSHCLAIVGAFWNGEVLGELAGGSSALYGCNGPVHLAHQHVWIRWLRDMFVGLVVTPVVASETQHRHPRLLLNYMLHLPPGFADASRS